MLNNNAKKENNTITNSQSNAIYGNENYLVISHLNDSTEGR